MKNKAFVSFVLIVLFLISVFPMSTLSGAAASQSSSGHLESPSSVDSTDWWPMFHHDLSRSGTSTSTGPTTNNILWTYTTLAPTGCSPAVVGGFVYVGSQDGNIYCLNSATGALVWNSPVGYDCYSSPAVVGGYVYVGSADGNFHCLNAANGALVWSFPTGYGETSSPAVVGNFVYVGSGNKNVYCLNAATGAVVWSYNTGGSTGSVESSPAVVGGFVYVGSANGNVYCLNAGNGALVWSFPTGNKYVYSSPAVVGGFVYIGTCYVGTAYGNVYCLNAATGAVVWSFTTSGWIYSSPAVVGGFVYVGSEDWDDTVYCLNAATGAVVWSYKTGGSVDSSPAVVGGFVYVGSYDGNVYCLNAGNGALVWSYKTGSGVHSSPAAVDGIVYVGSQDCNIYAFGPPSGISSGTDWWPMFHHALNHTGYSTSTRAPNTNEVLWKYPTLNWVASSPAVVNGIVYVGSGDTNVYALNASTGSPIWKTPTPEPVFSSPAVADGKVYVGWGDSYVRWNGGVGCLNALSGGFIWTHPLGCPVQSSPAVVGGVVFVGAYDGNVYALDAATGQTKWSFPTNNRVFSSPAVANGVVYVGSNDSKVYALKATTGAQVWNFPTGGAVHSSPAVASGLVYVGSFSGNVYCLNSANGALVWSFATGAPVESSPAVVGGVVFVGSDNTKVYALNAQTGQHIWSFATAGQVLSSPGVADGKVYVGSYASSGGAPFYCLNASTGAFIWSYKTNSATFDGSPAIVGGVVYVGADDIDNQVYAFESSTTVQAYCNTQGAWVNVAITLDGSPTGYTTPHTFTSLSIARVGTHTITVPNTDLSGHPFKNWNTGETTPTITVSIAGFTYIAYYQAGAPAGKTQLTTDPSTQDMPSLTVVNNGVFQGYFLAYQSWETGTANNGDIFVEKYDTNWKLLKRVQATSLSSYQDSPSLALVFDGTNYYLELAYVSTETTDGYYHIFAQKFDLNLNFITKKQITSSASSSSDQDLPSIIFDGSQSIYVAYQSWETGDSYQGDIFIDKLDLNLNPLSRVRVTTESSYQDCPSLLYNPTTGTIYVAYVSNETGNLDIFKKHYDSNLNDLGVKAQLTTDPTAQYRPSLAPIYGSTVSNIQGLQMAYHSWETGPSNQRDIFVENFELVCPSWGKTQITNDQFYSATPSLVPSLVALGSAWCPGYVAYVSNETGNWDIWLQPLTSTPPTTYNVHLESLEYTGASSNKGSIVFDGVSYPFLPTDTSKAAGTYSVSYTPASGYQFDHLQTSGSISVSGSTAVVVTGAGTVTVVYKAIPPSTYSATIAAYCYTQGGDVAVAVSKDGSPSGSTPQTFTGLTGSHTFMVPNTDASGDAFKQWSTGSTSLTITVSSAGTYTAYYGAVQGPVVYVSPYLSVVKVGRNVTIAVNVANVTNLYSWQIKLYFNSSSVSCTDASYPDYHIFAGKPFTQVAPVIGQNYIGFGASLEGSGRFDGSGTLCLINFTSLKEGTCPLQFDATNTFLLDSNLNSIPTTTSPGLITVVPTSPLIEDITGPNGVPDGTVNMYDISLVSKYFLQTVPPAPSICDITGQTPGVPDGKIDMKDISLVAKHFLEHYP